MENKLFESSINQQDKRVEKDYLWLHLRELPYFRSLVRAVEASYYPAIDLPEPILDVGCGDGHFASIVFDQPVDVGIDPWWEPLMEAKKRHAYHLLLQGDASRMPFPDSSFGSAFSNSVLEHIPQVEAVLAEISRVLKPGAPFVFCTPNHQFLSSLSMGRFFDRMRLGSLGTAYRSFFNRISRHHHSDPPEVWQARLEAAGLTLVKWWHYYSPTSHAVTEWGHYLGLPCLVSHKLTGRWIISPTRWNLGVTERLVRRYADNTPRPDGVYTFFIARRQESRSAL